jgi:hypothetical protein
MLTNMNYKKLMKKVEVKKFSYIPGKYNNCKVIKKLNSNISVNKKIMVITKFDDTEFVVVAALILLLGIGIGMMISEKINK